MCLVLRVWNNICIDIAEFVLLNLETNENISVQVGLRYAVVACFSIYIVFGVGIFLYTIEKIWKFCSQKDGSNYIDGSNPKYIIDAKRLKVFFICYKALSILNDAAMLGFTIAFGK